MDDQFCGLGVQVLTIIVSIQLYDKVQTEFIQG
jgi:hypothetical protein